jgi:tripartite-type tricarboxylate transporter receptor subunit TctC
VVPIPLGGSANTVARTVAQKLGDAWGQSVLVDNRAGANGILATELVAKSKPDGYTLLLALATHTINPMLYPNLPFNSSRDFAPVTVLAEYPFGLGRSSLAPRQIRNRADRACKSQTGTAQLGHLGHRQRSPPGVSSCSRAWRG